MRIFLVLICSFALAFATVAQGAKKEDKPAKKKKGAPAAQVSRPGGRPPAATQRAATGRATTETRRTAATQRAATGRAATETRRAAATKRAAIGRAATETRRAATTKRTAAGRAATETRRTAATGRAAAGRPATTERRLARESRRAGKPVKAQRFNLATHTRPARIQGVKFQQNRRIRGSDGWVGRDYWAFRNYRSEWHDRDWWRRSHSRIVFVFGGWYYWNSGYWFPAWGYDPGAYYAYDGPIYAYNDLPPDQVVANVQAALQEQGYYHGEVDGLLGPLTRDAIANYQRDHGLYTTSTIDRPTLESLGMA
jgi:hypothetical protein